MFFSFLRSLILGLILVFISICFSSAQSRDVNIYLTYDLNQYLQMAILMDKGYLLHDLYLRDEEFRNFRSHIDPERKMQTIRVHDEMILSIYREKYLSPDRAVLVNSENHTTRLLGAEIARQLEAPLFFSREKLKNLYPETRVIQVGGGNDENNSLYLHNLQKTYEYYQEIRAPGEVQVLVEGGEYSIAGLRLAAEHDGIIVLKDMEGILEMEGSAVIWVAHPLSLSREKIHGVMDSMDFSGDGIYDYPLGVFTGITFKDLLLMVERNLYLGWNNKEGPLM